MIIKVFCGSVVLFIEVTVLCGVCQCQCYFVLVMFFCVAIPWCVCSSAVYSMAVIVVCGNTS